MQALGADAQLAAQLERVRLESDTLYAIIAAVGASVDLDRVLEGIVELLTVATSSHACFVYLRDGERLRMRAASPVFAHLVGHIELGLDEGLTGWVARHDRPAFIREDALADPRMKYVPELEEERFQSMVAVPVPGRAGSVIGVVVLHTVAPREFDRSDLNFLAHVAALVAGAIENAKLYEEVRQRVEGLTRLSTLSQAIAAAAGRDELQAIVTTGVADLVDADRCELHQRAEGSGVLLDVLRQRRPERLAAPLTVAGEELGILTVVRDGRPFDAEEDELLRTVAGSVALALQQAELIERLTAENLVRDLFGALAGGDANVADARVRTLGHDLARPHVVLHGERAPARDIAWPAVAERLEASVRTLRPAAITDVGREHAHFLLMLDAATDLTALHAELSTLAAAAGAVLGCSGVHRGALGTIRALREAADAAVVGRSLAAAGGALAFEELGAYRYLVHLAPEDAPRDRQTLALERVVAYDLERDSRLLDTLERHLRDRRNLAATARELFIHPNTLRQRLDRIAALTGLDLAKEDLLSLELAVKLVRLRQGTAAPAGLRA